MGLWNKDSETKLERDLRAQRPQPRDEFVRMLSRQVAPLERGRRLALPKLALVAAVTAALAASLGAAGALGSAGGSVHTFSVSIVHLVVPPKAPVVPSTNSSHNNNNNNNNNNNSNGQQGPEYPPQTNFPFQHQYGHHIHICWRGQIIEINQEELFWYLTHGGRPPGLCLKWHTTP